MAEIFKEFHFDAAHHIAMNVPPGHPYSRIHGHSFSVLVTLRGQPDPKTGWVVDFADVEKAIDKIKSQLDHNYLNDVPGLEIPTLENISCWIWNALIKDLPLLYSITTKRGTLGEGCTYRKADVSSSLNDPSL